MGLFNSDRHKTNWDKLRSWHPGQTLGNRDVYEDQQLERSNLGEKQSPVGRIIFAAVLTVLVSIATWFLTGLISSIASGEFLQHIIEPTPDTLMSIVTRFTFGKFVIVLAASVLFFAFFYILLMKNKDAQDALHDGVDINQYKNDQHIALPEEIQEKFDWFPDVGATSDVQFSSMISHMALSNKGIKTIQVAQRAKADILDEDGEIVLYKGEVLRDEAGNVLYESKPLIDTDFTNALFDASGLPKKSREFDYRRFYDATKIKYNPGNRDRDKLQNKAKPYNTVADLINADWQFPYYEPQRPAGAYCVDTAPVNTMVLAMVSM